MNVTKFNQNKKKTKEKAKICRHDIYVEKRKGSSMSVGRVSGNFEYDKEYSNSSVNNQDDVTVFGDSQVDENYSELSPVDNSLSSQQVNLANPLGGGKIHLLLNKNN